MSSTSTPQLIVRPSEAAGEWVTSGGKVSRNFAVVQRVPDVHSKVACLGDSVHALVPESYQGGSQSIEDGATLAITLALVDGREHTEVRLALKAYEALRRDRVDEAQAIGLEVCLFFRPKDKDADPYAACSNGARGTRSRARTTLRRCPSCASPC